MRSSQIERSTSTCHVVLVGLMGSGKTTVGLLLAARLGRAFIDNDIVLATRTGQTAREIAAAVGADALHIHEAEALVFAVSSPAPAVVAAAAAAPLEPFAAAAMRAHEVIYLRATPDVLATRLARAPDDHHRPFVADDPRAVLDAQFVRRDERYRALATLVVDAGVDGPGAIVDAVSVALAP